YIIDEVHMLSSAAFNAFLKTLEEPPSYAIFILATTEKHKILPTILSRCQVFDFRRITVADITRHLADIARKEGIEAEPQALHTIAQKADGGLRDALSIFDQLVSFAGNTLTYQDVLQNLNVLDHEHYFRVTDNIIQGDIPATLVEFNSILQQGFDGHLFVTGLARHLRDLLVSQDPRTLALLEVSEDLLQRYGQQAKAADRDLLVRGLDRLAQCDSNYKTSKEPRLLVELALIHLCRSSGDAAEGIRTPPQATEPASAQKKSPDATVTPPDRGPVVADALPPSARPVEPVASGSAYTPKRRLVGQVSIRSTMNVVAEPETPSAPVDVEGSGNELLPKKEVNVSLLRKVWADYAARCKEQGRTSLHATLAAREPKVLGIGRVGFAIVNEVQENYLRSEKPELLGFLRRQLGDPGLELEVEKEEVKVRPRYTPLDKFRLMAEKNPALLKLREELDLDLG
ncbi:MAG: DNA polymerase III subunit gamma/tau, partial [Flavobacteriales bacterium]|nr:DNA polymerase III subunit gamma/tau [Flavobacteriales bacterium]